MRANCRSLKSLKPYSIPFTGLKTGSHVFDFTIDDSFFAGFEYSLVKKGNLKCVLEMEKQETMMILDFHITGELSLNCDRCLADFLYPVDVSEQQIAKFSDDLEEENEDIIILTKNETEIDVSNVIYELITISVPFVSTCGDEGETRFCDKSMLEKLNNLAQNTDAPGDDPRWDALKKLNK